MGIRDMIDVSHLRIRLGSLALSLCTVLAFGLALVVGTASPAQSAKFTCKAQLKLNKQFRGRVSGKIPRKRYLQMQQIWEVEARRKYGEQFGRFENARARVNTCRKVAGRATCTITGAPCSKQGLRTISNAPKEAPTCRGKFKITRSAAKIQNTPGALWTQWSKALRRSIGRNRGKLYGNPAKAIDKSFKCFFPKIKGGSISSGGSIGSAKVCTVSARPCR